VKRIIERVRNITDRVERRTETKINLLYFHVLYTTYPKWNFFEPKPNLVFQRSATTRRSHGTTSLVVR